jgi:Methyltransferase domain
MNMQGTLPRKYLAFAPALAGSSVLERTRYALDGLVLWPIYWLRAYRFGTPGLKFRKYFLLRGVRLLLRRLDVRSAYRLIVMPLDSVRYFEFDFMWTSVLAGSVSSYLDVSSPRLFPLMVIDRCRGITADMINPDTRDLGETAALARKLGIDGRCRFHSDLIDDVRMEPASCQLITSMSVVEHISDDRAAIRKMWDLLAPGGKLLITLPCAREAYEEYTNQNDYELNAVDEKGFIFFQRYYDERLLQENIFSIAGVPARSQIYGERQAGTYFRNEEEKRANASYPYWRAPYDVGVQYRYYERISDLAGIGVIALEFVKPAAGPGG